MVRRVVASGDSGWAPTALHKEEECERQLHPKENSMKVALIVDREEGAVAAAIRPVLARSGAGG
jgi:hypothetical protein